MKRFEGWNHSELRTTSQSPPEVVLKNVEPLVRPFQRSPVPFPWIVGSEEIVFLDSVGTSLLDNQVHQQIAGRVGVKLGIVTDLHAVQLPFEAQSIIHGYTAVTQLQEDQPQPSTRGRSLREPQIEFLYRGIGLNCGSVRTFPCCCFDAHCIAQSVVQLVWRGNDLRRDLAERGKPFISAADITAMVAPERL
jgi:hypothetical protein